MAQSVMSDGEDADTDDRMPGASSLSAAVNALTSSGARRQVRLAVPLGGGPMSAGGGGRAGADDDRRGCRGTLNERSLFIFSEENFIRKYAKIIIEWGYPLRATLCRITTCSVRRWLQLQFDCDSTAIRPFYDHSTTNVTTGLLHCGFNK